MGQDGRRQVEGDGTHDQDSLRAEGCQSEGGVPETQGHDRGGARCGRRDEEPVRPVPVSRACGGSCTVKGNARKNGGGKQSSPAKKKKPVFFFFFFFFPFFKKKKKKKKKKK